MSKRKCLNKACEWHVKGTCKLFPGEFGFLECRHSKDIPEKKVLVVQLTKEGKKK